MNFIGLDKRDVFEIFCKQVDEYLSDMSSEIKAINCAITAWHLSEYVWINDKLRYKEVGKCPSLELMRQIINGYKHNMKKAQSDGDVKIQSVKRHNGEFSYEFSHDFDISCIEIIFPDGSKKYFDDEIEKVKEFWEANFS